MQEQDNRQTTLLSIAVFQFMAGLVLFIALLNYHRGFIILALLFLITSMGARLWSRLSHLRTGCHLTIDKKRGFPGELFDINVKIENSKILPISFRVQIPIDDALLSPSSEIASTRCGRLLWYQKVNLQSEFIAKRRGWYRVGPPRLMTGDIFDFFQHEEKQSQFLHLTVYPKLVPIKSFHLPKRELFGIPGGNSPVQDPVYVVGTRDYQHWRPAKFIHWKASARYSRLQEKVCEPTVQLKVLLVVDVEHFAVNKAEDSFERILEAVASLAHRLEGEGCPVGLATNGRIAGEGPSIVPIARNPQQLPSILEVLARLQIEPTGPMVDILLSGLQLPWGVSCIYASYTADKATLPALDFYSQSGIPVVSVVSHTGPDSEDALCLRNLTYSLDEICV